ncbi:MAG: PepSY domain-containing protein [Rhodospirillales bacterium]|nr:PepSY domain-containing protein [Rhodospirillales bacterium]
MSMQKFLRGCRFAHSWLGIFVLPWIIAIGLTGVYLNHWRVIYPVIESSYSEIAFQALPVGEQGTQADAERLAAQAWPDQQTTKTWRESYHDRPAIYVQNAKGLTILSITTGHYYVKSRYLNRTYAPDGELLNTKVYWGPVFKDLHQAGWLGWGLGTWIADIVGGAMALFGLTGMMMWGVPRVRRLRARLQG